MVLKGVMILKRFYVYQLRAENEEYPFYIGKGTGKRMKQHLTDARMGEKSLKCSKIRKYEVNGVKVLTEKLFESYDENECFKLEIKLIKKYGRRDIGTGILTNSTDGGEGASGRIMSKEEKQYRSIIMSGKIRSEEHCKNISISKIGHEVTDETRYKISKKLKYRPLTRETIDKIIESRKGYKHSEATKKKISDSQKGKVISKEQRKKISDTLKGNIRNEKSVNKGSKYTREEAFIHIKKQMFSGLTQKEYCEKNKIKEQTFCGWKRSRYIIEKCKKENIELDKGKLSKNNFK